MKVIRITAIWCMSCLVMRRQYDKAFEKYNIKNIVDLDFDNDSEHVNQYDIGSILPVVIFFKDEKEVLRIVGEKSKKKLNQLIEGVL